MSIYLADIQAYVDLNFTDAQGFNAAFRSAFSTYTDNNMIPLVDINNPTDDYTVAIWAELASSGSTNYNNASGALRIKFFQTFEYAINLVIQNSVSPSAAARIFAAHFTQTGVDPPVVTIVANTIGGAAPVASRIGVGEYNITFGAGSFPDLAKINRQWKSTFAPVGDFAGIARFQVVSATVLKILTYKSGVVGADVTYTAADAILNETDCLITVYP